jgi:hypothetical protein
MARKNIAENETYMGLSPSLYMLDLLSEPNPKDPCHPDRKEQVIEHGRPDILIASDLIYSPELTEALVLHLRQLLSHGAILIIAVECRWNAVETEDGCQVRDVSQDTFFAALNESWTTGMGERRQFEWQNMDIENIPSIITPYERSNDLRLWEIRITTQINL